MISNRELYEDLPDITDNLIFVLVDFNTHIISIRNSYHLPDKAPRRKTSSNSINVRSSIIVKSSNVNPIEHEYNSLTDKSQTYVNNATKSSSFYSMYNSIQNDVSSKYSTGDEIGSEDRESNA